MQRILFDKSKSIASPEVHPKKRRSYAKLPKHFTDYKLKIRTESKRY
jgi:hypothetical protein